MTDANVVNKCLEPEAVEADNQVALTRIEFFHLSIAISLKRIADLLAEASNDQP